MNAQTEQNLLHVGAANCAMKQKIALEWLKSALTAVTLKVKSLIMLPSRINVQFLKRKEATLQVEQITEQKTIKNFKFEPPQSNIDQYTLN